uniref:Lipocalin/cytosolic fatty-acid binding domain-containing protein n=1 Tax=Monodon monoceros TaxID=40151 RepID=A0A8C6C9C3_MONMO
MGGSLSGLAPTARGQAAAPLPCSVVGGVALDPGCGFPGAAPLQLSIPPVFRYLVRDCLRSNLEPQGSPRMKKMGAVMVQQEGPHLALTSVSDHTSRCVEEKSQAVKGSPPGSSSFLWRGKEVTVVASDYETYSIMNTVFHKGGKAHSVLKLYSRMVEHDEKATDRLLVKAMEHGLSAVDVQLLSKDCKRPGPRGRPRSWHPSPRVTVFSSPQ